MKKSLVLFIKCLIPAALYILMAILTDSLITLFDIDMSHFKMHSQQETFMGLFTVAIIQILVLTLVANRSKLKSKHLAWLLSVLFFTINHALNVIESLVFLRNIYPVSMQMVNLLIGLTTAIVLGYAIAYLRKPSEENQEDIPVFIWSKNLVLSWAGWIIIWFIIYICAGALIPMNVDGVHEFYFSGEGAMDISLVPIAYLMQIPRGSIWILLAIALQKYQKGTSWEKSLVTGIVFGCLMSSTLLIPNFLMPDIVRMAHLPEILYANLLWGIIISWKVNKHFIPVVGASE